MHRLDRASPLLLLPALAITLLPANFLRRGGERRRPHGYGEGAARVP